VIPIPDGLRMVAVRAGVPEPEVNGLWARHLSHCDKEHADYGGPMWRALVDRAAKDGPSVASIPRDDPEVVALRRREQEAKALEEQEYRRTAISLEEWLADLRAKGDFLEALTPHEAKLVAFRERRPGESAGAWLMAALRGAEP
jgi:hypothetical protein